MREKKILIVDDEPDCRTILETILSENGFTVITAENGHEAIEKAEDERPDLILLDVVMESYTAGCNAIARLRESKQTEDIPVILITGLELECPEDDTEGSAKPMQAHDYIRKPVDPDRVLQAVRNALRPSDPTMPPGGPTPTPRAAGAAYQDIPPS